MIRKQVPKFGNLKFGRDPLNNIQKNIGLNVPGKIIPIKIGYNIQHSIDGFLKLDLPE